MPSFEMLVRGNSAFGPTALKSRGKNEGRIEPSDQYERYIERLNDRYKSII